MVARFFGGSVDADRVNDPAGVYIAHLLTCPTLASQAAHSSPIDSSGLLASRCNFR